MGNNAAYGYFEETVIGAYDLGKLDKNLLGVLMKPYAGCDIDSGGSQDLQTKDGKGVVEVVLTVMGVKVPEKPKLPKDWRGWTHEQSRANDDWQDAIHAAFDKITDKFGWD